MCVRERYLFIYLFLFSEVPCCVWTLILLAHVHPTLLVHTLEPKYTMWEKEPHARRNIIHTGLNFPGEDEGAKLSRAKTNDRQHSLHGEPKTIICPVNSFSYTACSFNTSGLFVEIFSNSMYEQCQQEFGSVVMTDIDQTGERFPLEFISPNRSLFFLFL